MITAQEFIEHEFETDLHMIVDDGEHIKWMMIEFAKMHVKQALEKAHYNFQLPQEDLEFTLSCYPEDLIK